MIKELISQFPSSVFTESSTSSEPLTVAGYNFIYVCFVLLRLFETLSHFAVRPGLELTL